jgi:hypothetical protein
MTRRKGKAMSELHAGGLCFRVEPSNDGQALVDLLVLEGDDRELVLRIALEPQDASILGDALTKAANEAERSAS